MNDACLVEGCPNDVAYEVRTPPGAPGVVRRLRACEEHVTDATDEVRELGAGEPVVAAAAPSPAAVGDLGETNEEIAERVSRAADESSIQHAPGTVVHSGPGVAHGAQGVRPDEGEIPAGIPGGPGDGGQPDPAGSGPVSEPGADPGQPAGSGRA